MSPETERTIKKLVALAPKLTPEQIEKIRRLVQAALRD